MLVTGENKEDAEFWMKKQLPRRRIGCKNSCRLKMCNICAFLPTLVIVTELFYAAAAITPRGSINKLALPREEFGSPKKLLQYSPPDQDGGGDQNRIGASCSKDDIVIYQGATPPLPTGVPSYSVQVLNSGVSGCTISDIHVTCGWFSSDRMVNPLVFRRLDYDDCVVNDGEGLGPGEALSFQYASSFPYPMSVSSAACC